MMKNYRFAIGIMAGFIFGTFQVSLLTADEIEATVTVSQKVPTAHADMGESKVNDGTIRSFTVDPIFDPEKEALDPESVSFSSGGDAAWFHQAGSLTAVEIPTLDSCGDFGVIIKGTIVAKKVEDKSQGSGTSGGGYAFTGSGSYGIAKCTQPFKADTSKTDWNPAGKNLVGYPCVIHFVDINCTVDPITTLDSLRHVTEKVVTAACPPGKTVEALGFFYATYPDPMDPVSQGKVGVCPVCKTTSYHQEKFLVDFKFYPDSAMIVLPKWTHFDDAGPISQKSWTRFSNYAKTHELQHQEDYKNNLLGKIYPITADYQICRNHDKIKYQSKDVVIDTLKLELQIEAFKVSMAARKAYEESVNALDRKADEERDSWDIQSQTPLDQ